MNRFLLLFLSLAIVCLHSCKDDDDTPGINEPADYTFVNDSGESTVSFSGQTTRILMAGELASAMTDFNNSAEALQEFFANETAAGEDANPFADADLNASTKSVRSKVAASKDYFSANTVAAAEIKTQFDNWILNQVNEVSPNENNLAAAGIAGQIADGSKTRYVNAQGLENNQVLAKGLIGALMTDQILNNYLSPAVLDEGENIANNNNNITETDKPYTTMEHKWDEAYGYLFGTAASEKSPLLTIGEDDSFLNKYVGSVNEDVDFNTTAQSIFDAFKRGRAAIVAGDYDERDMQAEIIQQEISKVIAVRAVYYLQAGKTALAANEMGTAFHALSEAYGFIYSLQFTRKPGTAAPYFSRTEVTSMLNNLLNDGSDGLWQVQTGTLDALSQTIADQFNFTVAQAAE